MDTKPTFPPCPVCTDEGHSSRVDITNVQEKFRQYCVCVVMQISDINHLRQVVCWYTPDSQPRNRDEWLYVSWVAEAAEIRISQLEEQQRKRRRIDRKELDGVRRNLMKEWDTEE